MTVTGFSTASMANEPSASRRAVAVLTLGAASARSISACTAATWESASPTQATAACQRSGAAPFSPASRVERDQGPSECRAGAVANPDDGLRESVDCGIALADLDLPLYRPAYDLGVHRRADELPRQLMGGRRHFRQRHVRQRRAGLGRHQGQAGSRGAIGPACRRVGRRDRRGT